MPQSLYASTEQLVDSADVRGSVSGIGLGASLLLHLGIVGLIFLKQPDTSRPEVPPAKATMVVSISSTNPQRKQPSVSASAGIDVENPVPELPQEQQVAATEPQADITTAEETVNPDESAADQPNPDSSTDVTSVPELPANQSVGNPGTRGISPAEVNNSVTAYIANYKSSLTGDWLTACLKYQNEHGVKNCPSGEDGKSDTTKAVNATTGQLFRVYVSGAAENERASKKLLAEMEAMRPFMKENSVMGELARQRYQLAEGSYCNFNSCRGAATDTSGSFATPVSNEGFIGILSFAISSSGITFSPAPPLSALMSLISEPKPTAVKPFVPYRFTANPEQQAESEGEFKVEAPIFPIRR